MCGRFALKISPKVLAAAFGLDDVPDYAPRYNIAPGQDVAAMANDESADRRVFRWFQWGLVPGWAKEPAGGLINARSETASSKPAFRDAFRRRRCLIPADGFYEWQKVNDGKQAYFFCRQDNGPMAMAGLWELWQGAGNATIESCAILTTTANKLMQPIHNRMPVIIGPDDFDLWLDPEVNQPQRLADLCKPFAEDPLRTYPVGSYVNNPRNEGQKCIEPADQKSEDPRLFDE